MIAKTTNPRKNSAKILKSHKKHCQNSKKAKSRKGATKNKSNEPPKNI